MNKSLLFLGTFAVALIIQSLIWRNFEYVDKQIWTDEARFVQTVNPEAFNKLVGYGHPGGPVIEATIAAHMLFGVSYEIALSGSLAVVNALIIAACALMCYMLRPNTIWWFIIAGTLSVNRLYPNSTPPSGVIAPLIVLLVLLALWLYEKAGQAKTSNILIFGAIIGLAGATRSDITPAMTLPLLLILYPRLGLKNIGLIILSAIISFWLTDPFMWIMSPFQHVWDLITEVTYHYKDYPATHISPLAVLLVSPMAFISMIIAIISITQKKKLPPAIPTPFLVTLLITTIIITAVLLTARSQAPRYFFPLAFIWETLLPLFILQLLPYIKFSFLTTEKQQQKGRRLSAIVLATILIAGQAVLLIHLYFLPEVIFVCPQETNRWLFCNHISPWVW